VAQERNVTTMARVQQRDVAEIARRFADGHRAYVASVHGEPAAFGWVATHTARLGELGTTLTLTDVERYLWNFVTLPAWRGRGIYPQLLDAIVQAESFDAELFWIAYAPENRASGRGIEKAGFRPVADLSFEASGAPALHAIDVAGAFRASAVLGLPVVDEPLAPCWRCVRAGRAMTCAEGQCACDYQVSDSGCSSTTATAGAR
jgi:GNAT superfamily N-acetyltransferase